MLHRASLDDLKNGSLQRAPGRHLVIAMRVYPRFVAKTKIDEYQQSLSPEPKLFAEYRGLCVRFDDHEKAFETVNYEERFDLNEKGHENLARLAKLAKSSEVYLFCRCGRGEHCHVDLMLLMAQQLYSASIEEPNFGYQRFRARLKAGGISAPTGLSMA